MDTIKPDETYKLELIIKVRLFHVSIGIKILFFTVSVTIEPGHSLLTVRYHELSEKDKNIQFHVY